MLKVSADHAVLMVLAPDALQDIEFIREVALPALRPRVALPALALSV
jgi:hypothetical protein